jgi:2-dehydropantoate 2-reductase
MVLCMSEVQNPSDRVVVVGPGAIGGAVAACLYSAGHRVTLCGRSAQPDLHVVTERGETIVVPGPVYTDPGDVAPAATTVFLAVKATQLPAAAAWLDRLCGPGTTVVALLNGVEHQALVEPYAVAATVVPAVVWFPAIREGGRIVLQAEPSLTLPDGRAGRAVAALLAGSGCRIELTDDLVTVSWRKLLQNAAAAIMAITGRKAGVFAREDIAELTRRYVGECLAVARAEGARLPDDIAEQIVVRFREYQPGLGTSILTDREARRPLEWSSRNGVVTRLARVHGISTPIGDVLVPLLAAASDGPG